MSRTLFPFHTDDISALARSLVKQWKVETEPPSHVQMLNMLARSAGYQNFQHFRSEAEVKLAATPSAPVDAAAGQATVVALNVRRLMRHFDAQGRLIRWPTKFSEQQPCLWPIWARIPARLELRECDVNEAIKQGETFGDHVLIRRELVNYRMLQRTRDGSVYKRIEQPLAPATALLVHEVLDLAHAQVGA